MAKMGMEAKSVAEMEMEAKTVVVQVVWAESISSSPSEQPNRRTPSPCARPSAPHPRGQSGRNIC